MLALKTAALALGLAPFLTIAHAQVLDVGASNVNRFRLSADGLAGLGQRIGDSGQQEVFRWTEAGGLETLATLNGQPGVAVEISSDGSIACGTAIGPSSAKRALRWDASGSAQDISLPGASSSRPVAMSRDGNLIGLEIDGAVGQAALWTPSLGTFDLTPQVGQDRSRIIAVSGDGSTALVLGLRDSGSSVFFLWSASSGLTAFPPAGEPEFTPTGISFDGNVVVGYSGQGPESSAARWSASTGVEFGQPPTGQLFTNPRLSPDGSTVYGVAPASWGVSTVDYYVWSYPGSLQMLVAPMSIVITGSTFDGSTLVGKISATLDAPGRAVSWSAAGGVVELDSFSGDSRATSISDDGSRIGGMLETSAGMRAVIWETDGELGTSYCGPGVANSTGGPASMSLSGSNVSDFGALTLSADGLPPNSLGLFIASQASGFSAMPGGSQGNLCLGGAIGRFSAPDQVQNSGASGTFSLDVDPRMFPGPQGPILPGFGETWHFQAWHRDVNPALTSNFTDGVMVEIY